MKGAQSTVLYTYLILLKMRIDPPKPQKDPFEDLSPLQKKTRKAAIVFAFIGVFVWAVKILFL